MKINDRRYKEFKRDLKKLFETRIVLGAVGDHSEAGMSNAQLFRIHEEGRPRVGIPMRAPIRKTFRIRGNLQRLEKVIINIIKQNGIDINKLTTGIGQTMKALVQRTIMKRVDPPNSPATLLRKRGDVPLIDRKQMVQSLDHGVIKK